MATARVAHTIMQLTVNCSLFYAKMQKIVIHYLKENLDAFALITVHKNFVKSFNYSVTVPFEEMLDANF